MEWANSLLLEREGWSIVTPVRNSSSRNEAWAEIVGEGPIGESKLMTRLHIKLISVPGWVYVIEVFGSLENDDKIAQYYQVTTASFQNN